MTNAMEPEQSQETGLSLTEKVRQYILEKSKTLAEIHKMTGIPKTTLGAWLKGEKAITTTVFDRICQAYGISPIRLCSGQDSNKNVPTIEELTTFREGEKVVLLLSLHQATQRAIHAEQRVRQKIADEMEKQAEIMRVDWALQQCKESRAHTEIQSLAKPRKG